MLARFDSSRIECLTSGRTGGVIANVVTNTLLEVTGPNLLIVAQGLASLLTGAKATSLGGHVRCVFVINASEPTEPLGDAVAVVDIEFDAGRRNRHLALGWPGSHHEQIEVAVVDRGGVGSKAVDHRQLQPGEQKRIWEQEVLDGI